MSKRCRRIILKVIFIVSVIFANCYWEKSSKVDLAFNYTPATSEEYKTLEGYAIEIARTRDANAIANEEIQAKMEKTGQHTLIVTVENKKCILTAYFSIDENFRMLEDGTIKIDEIVELAPINVIGNSKLPSKQECIITASAIFIASFTAIYILCYTIPNRIVQKRKEETTYYF